MIRNKGMFHWLFLAVLCLPFNTFAATPVKSIVVFGDSISDTGNTTHLLKSLRYEENPAFLVEPFKAFVVNKMIDFADYYYVPQMVLDAGLSIVTNFFDYELAPYIANLVGRVRLVPVLPGQPYWNDRFSNGRVWNEYLADMLNIQRDDPKVFTNKAFGGSWAATYDHQLTVWNLIRHPLGIIKTLIVGKLVPPSLGLTVQAYLLEHKKLDEKAVYFIFSGTNDYINILQFEDNYNPAVMSVYVDNVVDGLNYAILNLVKSGATHFVIMGIPNVGDMPRFVNTSDREVLNAAAAQHNEKLAKRIAELTKEYPTVDFLFINTANAYARTLNNPLANGFTNTKDACIDVKFPMYGALTNSPFVNNTVLQYAQVLQYRDQQFTRDETNYTVCETPDHYFFWDEIHPATRAHHYLAFEICSEMKNQGYDVSCKAPSLN